MASWLFAPSAFDLLLDKATSPLIPIGTHDLATNLDLADQIRAKQVQPRVAALAIKRKLTDRNPNVQLLALRVSLTQGLEAGRLRPHRVEYLGGAQAHAASELTPPPF